MKTMGRAAIATSSIPNDVCNETDPRRPVLMCDVERAKNPLGRACNRLYALVAFARLVPIIDENGRGALTAVAPLRSCAVVAKSQRRSAYVLLKYSLNAMLLLLAFLLARAVLQWLEHVGLAELY